MSINVLMCGGRRAGKTSVLAGIQKNMMDLFRSGDIVLNMQNMGRLVEFRKESESIFGYDYEDDDTFLADQRLPTMNGVDYECRVYMKDHSTRYDLCFTDVPGEWFIGSDSEISKLYDKLRAAHILVIAIDSPHLMEDGGKYHQVFNRADRITAHIKACFEGNTQQRMVIFVPVKSEVYRPARDRSNRMKALLEQVKTGYGDLINWLTTGANQALYTVVVAPCFTFGGAEFYQFVPPIDPVTGQIERDSEGKPLQPIGIMPGGEQVMQYLTEYSLLRDAANMHYYKPENCEQPLLYILLYLIAMCKVKGLFVQLWEALLGRTNNAELQACKDLLKPKIRQNPEAGFAILNDPLHLI